MFLVKTASRRRRQTNDSKATCDFVYVHTHTYARTPKAEVVCETGSGIQMATTLIEKIKIMKRSQNGFYCLHLKGGLIVP